MRVEDLAGGRRTAHVNVAGPASLILAKTFKIADRIERMARIEMDLSRSLEPSMAVRETKLQASLARNRATIVKDAGDIYRILRTVPIPDLGARYRRMLEAEISGDVARTGLEIFSELFSSETSTGPPSVATAMSRVLPRLEAISSSLLLAREFLSEIASCTPSLFGNDHSTEPAI
jgi:hypothetical protein